MTSCPFCGAIAGGASVEGIRFLGSLDPKPVEGWMVAAPARHVEGFDELTEAEARALGDVVRRGVAAIRAVTGVPKVYLSAFAEKVPHLHVHLFPRVAETPEERRGPRYLFDGAPRSTAARAKEVAAEILRRF